MVSRLMSTQELPRLTRENHPENAMPASEPQPEGTLGSTIAVGVLCGMISLVFGGAALSTAFAADTAAELISVLPLILMAIALLSGWAAAFVWMCREEAAARKS